MIEQSIKNIQETNPTITLQKITDADIGEYLEIEKKVGGKTYFPWTSEKEIRDWMINGEVCLIKNVDKVVGHVSYQIKEGNVLWLDGLVIDPQYQGQGLGRKAIEQIFNSVGSISKAELTVHPENYAAIKTYESLGFKLEERKDDYYGDGQPRLLLVRSTSNL